MAEASITVYIIVIIVGALFGLILRMIFQRRLRIEGRSYGIIKIKHENRNAIGILILFIGIYFISVSAIMFGWAEFWDNYVEESIKKEKTFYEKNTKIDFTDNEPFKTWITRAGISSSDSDPLTTEYERGLNVVVESKELPKALVVHIFHEEMIDFFTNNEDPTAYRQQTTTLNRLNSLEYGPMFGEHFELSEQIECDAKSKLKNEPWNCSFNTFVIGTFSKPGKYFVQFSAQLQDDSFDHRKSPLSLTTIMEPHDIWMEDKMKELIIFAESQKEESARTQGWNLLNIGIAMIIGGSSLIIPSIELSRHREQK